MKLLILSCNTGEGHHSAALAIAEAWGTRGGTSEVIEAISFGGEKPKRMVSGAYNSIIVKAPNLFGWIYRAGDWYRSTGLASPVYAANTLYAKKMLAYIEEKQVDAVLCTHLFPMEALTHLRRKAKLTLPCFGVQTDYTCTPFFEETEMDAYFCPHDEVNKECVAMGMRPDKLHATGIPVHGRFGEDITKEQARNYLVIGQEAPMYLVMTGGMGCGNIQELCRQIVQQDDGSQVYVLTGRNDALNNALKTEYGMKGPVHPVVFTEKVHFYMKAADVLLTKPGGISSTEAAVAGVPMVHTTPIPGCETRNKDFFVSHGLSVYGHSPQHAARAARELAANAAKTDAMRAAQRRCINPNAAADIVEYIRRVC